MKNNFALQVITYLEILDITQTSKKLRTCFLCGKKEISKKISMWIAASDCGMSDPLFCTSTAVAINTSIYINEYLRKSTSSIHSQVS